jgi:hypothetical protein
MTKKPKWSALQGSLRTLALEGTAAVRFFGESESAAAKLFVRVPYKEIIEHGMRRFAPGGAMWNVDLAVSLKLSPNTEVQMEFQGNGLRLSGPAHVFQRGGFTKLIGNNVLGGLAEAGLFPPP